ncbi:hypothetical protein [Cellulomonas fimi]|uniref:Protein kinase domain-containing protein n=1 Tax=Cellulomonas fimi (strain ATCC 484 / DSM 20113 / JCM 1341 / CCUG 24087 / LMG 16345 / NBRC 15513 / NCIMB 8980 / NCTC 7547 / NRS-133) TaxID=590998 RepID=F4H244_CELFA|nr:hypothetical protein [Cellulomonas fimi]AEE46341.1 hypothetical protein Celf_2213 [Cellulomonas fimi ATCC 484]NNH07141.1 hypothetical protein [Cellulomonas fimi]VEH32595.1 Uncharacterised protein [Cellulomonas fimi]
MDDADGGAATTGSMGAMDAYLVPADVRALLDGGAFRVVAPAGPDGTGWLAAATDGSGRHLEVHVLPTGLDDAVAARVERLRALCHEHLPVLLDAVEIGPGRTALVVEHMPGRSLAELRAERAPLSDGEAVTVAVPVAWALGALHDAGLVHGAVGAATVVVRPDGRPALVDLRSVVLGTGGPPDGDLRRLAATLLAQLPDADVALVAGPARATLRDALEPLAQAPSLTAGQVVDRCFDSAEAEPVRLPDAGALAARDLRAAPPRADPLPRRARPARERRRRSLVVGAVATAGALVTTAALVVGAVVLLGGGDRGATPTVHRQAGVAAGPGGSRDDAVAAAVRLTQERAQVLAAGDAQRLAQVEVVDGPAHRADVAVVAGLAGARLDGLAAEVTHAALADVDPGASADGGAGGRADVEGVGAAGAVDEEDVAVRVTSVMSAHRLLAADGTVSDVPASAPRTVVLVLRWTDAGWRVLDVTDASAA